MPAIIALLGEVLAQLALALNVSQAIYQIVNGTTAPSWLAGVQNFLLAITARLDQMAADLQALRTAESAATLSTFSKLDAISAKIDGMTGGTINIQLPPTPPPGYGTPGEDFIDKIWAYQIPGDEVRTGDSLAAAGSFVNFISTFNTPMRTLRTGAWLTAGDWGYPVQVEPNDNDVPPPPDFSTILPTDTSIQGWIERVYSVGYYSYTPHGMAYIRPTGQPWFYLLDLTPQQFEILRRERPATPVINAPVWPGAELVTLGDEVALANGLEVTGPMHGVIVKLDAVPSGAPQYVYGDSTATTNIGGLTFVSDSGESEHVSALSFHDQVFCPKAMSEAALCRVRIRTGVSGTIQPWFTTPP